MKSTFFLLMCGLFCFVSALSAQSTTYIHAGTLLDMTSDRAQSEMTIVVEDDKITDVRKGYATPPAGTRVVDLKAHTVMPGWMDMHVHIESESNPRKYLERYEMEDADVAYRAAEFARRTLMAGFTTVRDLGGTGVNVALRNAINGGWAVGPRIFTAEKGIATTGGHADPTNGMKRALRGDPGASLGVINSYEDARKAVRQRYKNGADVIKITATGGVLSVAKDGQGPQFMEDELRGIIQTANDYGMTTAAHAHGDEGMRRAVEAGITSIEHGTMMSETTMDLMKEKGTFYVPTISAGKYVAEKAKVKGFYPAVIVPKAATIGPKIQETFGKAYRRGVPIAFGTDAGVSPHGDNAKEFIFMHEAGMPVLEALRTATVHASRLLNISDTHGTVQVGKTADLVATRSNPLDDVNVVMDVVFVMKDGEVFKSDGGK